MLGGEHYFGQKSTYNIYPNKSPPTLLIFSPIRSLMPNFRQFWRANFEISEKNTTFWVWGPHTTHAGKRVPPRPATTKDSTRYARNHGRGHLAGESASVRCIWHMSSKGMPRHAHRRWALVTVCGVGISYRHHMCDVWRKFKCKSALDWMVLQYTLKRVSSVYVNQIHRCNQNFRTKNPTRCVGPICFFSSFRNDSLPDWPKGQHGRLSGVKMIIECH